MDSFAQDILLFLVILNPFAQVVYLSELINTTSREEFKHIFKRACVMTFCIYVLCAFIGEYIIFDLFQVSLSAMRIFGGLITLYLAFNFVMKGPSGIKLFSGDVTQLAQQITLPVMVGAGGVWVSMKIGEAHPPYLTVAAIFIVLLANGLFVLFYQSLLQPAKGARETAIIKYFGMAMRFNAMLLGAVGVEMVLGGITSYEPVVRALGL